MQTYKHLQTIAFVLSPCQATHSMGQTRVELVQVPMSTAPLQIWDAPKYHAQSHRIEQDNCFRKGFRARASRIDPKKHP